MRRKSWLAGLVGALAAVGVQRPAVGGRERVERHPRQDGGQGQREQCVRADRFGPWGGFPACGPVAGIGEPVPRRTRRRRIRR
jgi:hypothetical protein